MADHENHSGGDVAAPHASIWLYPVLKQFGIVKIEAYMSGSGDSGDIDDIIWFRDEKPVESTGMDAALKTLDTGSVVKWLVSEGDIVQVGDPICEVDPAEARLELAACLDNLATIEAWIAATPEAGVDDAQALSRRISELEERASHTILTADVAGYVNAFDPESAMSGYDVGETILNITPLANIEDILKKLTIDDGSHASATFLDALHTMLSDDASDQGNWYDNEGGSVFSSYNVDPEFGMINLIVCDYTPGEGYDDEEPDEDDFDEDPEEDEDDLEP